MKTWGWIALVLLAAGVGLLAGKAFLGGNVPGPGIVPIVGDPPIIVHGGSFRLGFNTTKDPGPPNKPMTVQLSSPANVDIVDLGRYLPLGTPFDFSTLSGKQWEVDVCDAGGLTQPSSSKPAVCTDAGLKIFPSDATGNWLANQTYITVDRLNSATTDTLTVLGGQPPPFKFGYKLKPASGKDIYHPGFLVVKIKESGGVTNYTYTCAPVSDDDGIQWTTCWARFGKYP